MNQKNKNIVGVIVVVLVIALIVWIEMSKPDNMIDVKNINVLDKEQKAALYPPAKELIAGGEFFNTEDGKPIKLSDYVGKKVILIDFWTYSCINCQRTQPYLNEWYKKYKDNGFLIVGVHSPEFAFEKNPENVKRAIEEEKIEYPVMQDNDMSTWKAYKNNYWPRKYLIDIDGYIVYDLIGEGSYDETEKAIQKALAERTKVLNDNQQIDGTISTLPEATFDANMSHETYLGAERNEFLGSGIKKKTGEQYFAEPLDATPNKVFLIGQWNITPEYAETSKTVGNPQVGSDRIDYVYNAKGVYLVAGSANEEIEVEVLLDSKPVEEKVKGADVYYRDGKSFIKVKNEKLYRIVDDTVMGKHFLELIISKPGFQAFAFTFG